MVTLKALKLLLIHLLNTLQTECPYVPGMLQVKNSLWVSVHVSWARSASNYVLVFWKICTVFRWGKFANTINKSKRTKKNIEQYMKERLYKKEKNKNIRNSLYFLWLTSLKYKRNEVSMS